MLTVRRVSAARFTAVRWFQNGDHPLDACVPVDTGTVPPFLSEGKVVRYFRHPAVPGERLCARCGHRMHDHGWIDAGHTPDGRFGARFFHGFWLRDPRDPAIYLAAVCPGNWVLTDEGGRYGIFEDAEFRAGFEVEDVVAGTWVPLT